MTRKHRSSWLPFVACSRGLCLRETGVLQCRRFQRRSPNGLLLMLLWAPPQTRPVAQPARHEQGQGAAVMAARPMSVAFGTRCLAAYAAVLAAHSTRLLFNDLSRFFRRALDIHFAPFAARRFCSGTPPLVSLNTSKRCSAHLQSLLLSPTCTARGHPSLHPIATHRAKEALKTQGRGSLRAAKTTFRWMATQMYLFPSALGREEQGWW
mmetsp:Transcript_24408/g.40110  ORF Transcript_24408/g.40110 Transcript_24408/m.40110 type:complete len:209 (-) Transcript_24408:438-1064(-)